MELTFQYPFEAAHRLLSTQSEKCQTPHGHSWNVRATFCSQGRLNENAMIEEFQSLKQDLRTFIEETVDHSYLHHVGDPIIPSLEEHIPTFRSLAFPGDPTTELITILFAKKLNVMAEQHSFRKDLYLKTVEIQETKTNAVTHAAHETGLFSTIREYAGWWDDPDPLSRTCLFQSPDLMAKTLSTTKMPEHARPTLTH